MIRQTPSTSFQVVSISTLKLSDWFVEKINSHEWHRSHLLPIALAWTTISRSHRRSQIIVVQYAKLLIIAFIMHHVAETSVAVRNPKFPRQIKACLKDGFSGPVTFFFFFTRWRTSNNIPEHFPEIEWSEFDNRPQPPCGKWIPKTIAFIYVVPRTSLETSDLLNEQPEWCGELCSVFRTEDHWNTLCEHFAHTSKDIDIPPVRVVDYGNQFFSGEWNRSKTFWRNSRI